MVLSGWRFVGLIAGSADLGNWFQQGRRFYRRTRARDVDHLAELFALLSRNIDALAENARRRQSHSPAFDDEPTLGCRYVHSREKRETGTVVRNLCERGHDVVGRVGSCNHHCGHPAAASGARVEEGRHAMGGKLRSGGKKVRLYRRDCLLWFDDLGPLQPVESRCSVANEQKPDVIAPLARREGRSRRPEQRTHTLLIATNDSHANRLEVDEERAIVDPANRHERRDRSDALAGGSNELRVRH